MVAGWQAGIVPVTGFDLSLDSLDAIVFDFDGVILESAAIKGEGFTELFSDHPNHLDQIRAHHLANLGVSRFRKFDWIYRTLFQKPLSTARRRELGEKYSNLVFKKTLECPMVNGARELLERLAPLRPLYVASATPQEELEAIIHQRRLGDYFAEVHGSPPEKGELLTTILHSRSLTPDRVLMVGDGRSDLEAANQAGCRFVARIDALEPDQVFPAGTASVPDLEKLGEILL